MDKLYVAIWN